MTTHHGMENMNEVIRRGRRRLLELHRSSSLGHIGGNFSCIDCLVVLHHCALGDDDVFLLSKGHSAGALYVALWSCGRISESDLASFACDGTLLGVHPPCNDVAVTPFGTGSLGHGPSLAAGIALGRRFRGEPGRVYCLCSDGEWQEGACWEALIFAAHQRLDSLCIIVDVNGWQGFGTTEEVASFSLESLEARFAAFGADVHICCGHDPEALVRELLRAVSPGRPQVLLMKTLKGNGVPDLENTLASHYLPLSEAQFAKACELLEP